MSNKYQKEEEKKYQNALYKNLYVLTLEYPPSNDFKKIFKTNMFEKPNKEAFHQVVYYLLYILSPKDVKVKLPSWPILDKGMEVKFRDEVLHYLNNINSTYENADIPPIMKSHLIAPGGYNFTLMMFRLSQLVFYQHLVKNHDQPDLLLQRIKLSKNDGITLKRIDELVARINVIETENSKIQDEFCRFLECIRNKANNIVNEQKKVDLIYVENAKKLEEMKTSFEAHTSKENIIPENMENYFAIIEEKLTIIKNLKLEFKKYNELVSYMQLENICLEHPLNNSKKDIDLINFLQDVTRHFSKLKHEFYSYDSNQLKNYIKDFNEFNEKLDFLQENSKNTITGMKKFVKELKKYIS